MPWKLLKPFDWLPVFSFSCWSSHLDQLPVVPHWLVLIFMQPNGFTPPADSCQCFLLGNTTPEKQFRVSEWFHSLTVSVRTANINCAVCCYNALFSMIPVIWFIFKHVPAKQNLSLSLRFNFPFELTAVSPTSKPGRIWVNFPIKDRDAENSSLLLKSSVARSTLKLPRVSRPVAVCSTLSWNTRRHRMWVRRRPGLVGHAATERTAGSSLARVAFSRCHCPRSCFFFGGGK